MNKRSGSILSVVFHDEERPPFLPIWFRLRDKFAVVPVNTTVVPLFHYVRDTSKIIYVDEPVSTVMPWVIKESDVYKAYDVLYFDCVNLDLDGLRWMAYDEEERAKWVTVLQPRSYVHELQGREFVGFAVQILDLRPYT